MNKALNLIIIVGSLALVLIVAFAAYNALSDDAAPGNLMTVAPTPSTTATTGTGTGEPQLAPDFTVYDADGKAYMLSDFRGKPVVLNYWASWCEPCKSEMPDFDEAYAKYGQDIHFLMVNLTDGSRETVETAGSFIASSGYSFPVYYDTDLDAAEVYGVNSVPVTYFIDRNGYLVAYGSGALSAATLEKGIGMILE